MLCVRGRFQTNEKSFARRRTQYRLPIERFADVRGSKRIASAARSVKKSSSRPIYRVKNHGYYFVDYVMLSVSADR